MPLPPTPSNPIRSLAIIVNALPPYRVHFHQRIAREMPEMKLWTVATHEAADQPWAYAPPAEINVMQFGPGESVTRQSDLKLALHEWKKGGRIIEWLAKENVQAVVVNGYNDAARMRILRWCHRNGIPVMVFGDSNVRGDRAAGFRAVLKRRMMKRVLRLLDGILVCGSLGQEYFLKYGADERRIFFTPYEPDYQAIERVDRQAMDAAARKYDLAPGRKRIVFAARFVPVKRPDMAIDAFAAIAGQRSKWDLVMVGSGPLEAVIKKRVPESLRSRVIFTGFIGDQDVVSAIYKLSDVLVLPSDYEPWALVINEAVAAGLAVICSDVVGAGAELVRNGVNGFTFPPGDLPAMIERLKEITQPEQTMRLKAASAGVLQGWRQKADPVEGMRQALAVVAHNVP
jgi:glycosyltransferase involved in cell wall biosynthesis